MEQNTESDRQATPDSRLTTVYNDGSWSVIFSVDENCLYVHTDDYHAGPLKIDRAMAAKIGSVFSTGALTVSEHKPSDPVVKINKKDHCAEIEVIEGWSGVIKLPRKELYRLGKKLRKRFKYA
jgi:hypothetical protein